MRSTGLALVAAAVCVLLLALAGPAAAQSPYYPMTPPSAPSGPPNTPEDRTLTTKPDRSEPAPQRSYLPYMLRRIQMPQASGAVKVAPADAAVIVVRVPDASADVLFDGERTYTAGTTRTFVTTVLADGQPESYKVSVRGGRDGAPKEREVEVEAGRISVVDFTRADGK